MKRILIGMLSMCVISAYVFGLTNEVLIDFNQTGNMDTLAQIAQEDEQKAGGLKEGEVSLTNLYNDEWIVFLNDSAQSVENRRLSYCKNVKTKGSQQFDDDAAGEKNVLGVRIHYPEPSWNSWAMAKPAFDLEFYGGSDGEKYTGGRGVVRNVGTIKKITSWVCGRNFNIAYIINLQDDTETEIAYPMGNLYFRGWRKVEWENPNYLADVRDRDLVRLPLYPKQQPAVKLDSLQFYRSKEVVGGDFVVYIRDVAIDYEEAVPPQEADYDVDDEDVWQILKTENDRKRKVERSKLKEIKELRDLERNRMQNNTGDETADGNATPAAGTAPTAAPAPTTP